METYVETYVEAMRLSQREEQQKITGKWPNRSERVARGELCTPHGPGSLGIPRKTYVYLFFWIFWVILIRY